MAEEKKKRPVVPAWERQRRVNWVVEMKLANYTYQEIHEEIGFAYKVAKNTIDKYIMDANAILEANVEDELEDIKALHLKQVQSLYKRTNKAGEHALELKVLEHRAKLFGLLVDKQETTLKGGLDLSPAAFDEYDAALEDFDAKGA